MKLGIQIGVMAMEWRDKGDTDERQPCDAAVEMAGNLGLEGLEVFERHIMAYYDRPDYMEQILDDAGMQLSGAYFPMDAALTDGGAPAVESARRACSFLNEVGGGYLLLNGGPPKKEGSSYSMDDFKTVAKTANAIGEIGQSFGISVVMHPHFKFMVETNDDYETILEAGLNAKKVGLCVHASHQVLAGSDPYVMYERHGNLVTYVHVGNGKSENGKHAGSFLGEGDLDQKRLMNPLLKEDFDGWIVIECSQDGVSTKNYVANTRTYLQSSFPEISWE